MGDGTYIPTTGDGEEPLIVQGQLVGQPVVTSSVVTSSNRQAMLFFRNAHLWCKVQPLNKVSSRHIVTF